MRILCGIYPADYDGPLPPWGWRQELDAEEEPDAAVSL